MVLLHDCVNVFIPQIWKSFCFSGLKTHIALANSYLT